MNKPKTGIKNISTRDLCQTPGYALEPLFKVIDVKLYGMVWEPANGEGYLSSALKEKSCAVVTSDVGEDFFSDYEPHSPYNAIITNPPYSRSKEFTIRSLDLRDRLRKNISGRVDFLIALLLPTETVSTKWFCTLSQIHEPGIIWFNPRINFKMPNLGWGGSGSQFPCAWFTWGWFTGNRFVRMDHWTKEYREKFEI